ncbi:hypothetical protein ES288_D09G045700v1 [Gossypium darwinii]|uniref:Uncharacterized protein n=1 Tax=Gossypium darwinii TaxID=34276 RepID=A0A5D2BB17_GOSDA|nr:hypothetical protein ES288_D09G045700v1 [Gossypium darwinii]
MINHFSPQKFPPNFPPKSPKSSTLVCCAPTIIATLPFTDPSVVARRPSTVKSCTTALVCRRLGKTIACWVGRITLFFGVKGQFFCR